MLQNIGHKSLRKSVMKLTELNRKVTRQPCIADASKVKRFPITGLSLSHDEM